MAADLLPIIAGVISDVLEACGCSVSGTGAGVFQSAVGHILQKRAETIREVMLQELRHGHPLTEPDLEELAGATLRVVRAALEGAAKNNLRIMARIIDTGLSQRALYADEFLCDADVIASLRPDEINILATVCRELGTASEQDKLNGHLVAKAGAKLIPSVFGVPRQFAVVCARLIRTGYLDPIATGTGGKISYGITSDLERLAKLVRFEEMDVGRPGGDGR